MNSDMPDDEVLYTRVLLTLGPYPGPVSEVCYDLDRIAERERWRGQAWELLGLKPRASGDRAWVEAVEARVWMGFWAWYVKQVKQNGDNKG